MLQIKNSDTTLQSTTMIMNPIPTKLTMIVTNEDQGFTLFEAPLEWPIGS